MGALDQITSFFKGDVNIDNPDLRQALKQAFPDLAKAGTEFDNLQYLPFVYVQEKIIPAIMVMDEARLQNLKEATKESAKDLHSLAIDVESSLRYKPRDGYALPSNQQIPERLKSSAKGIFKEAKDLIAETINLRTDAERELALMAEIIASANRSVVKFDRYVQLGDGKQYGDQANDWLEIDSNNVNIRRPENSKKIRHNVENVPKINFVTVVNEVVAMAKEPSVNVNIDGRMQPVGSGTRIEKLAYLASWMSALEEGTDKVLPNMLAEATTNAATGAVNTVVGTGWDIVTGVAGEYPVMTTMTLAAFGYATWKAGNLVKGILNIPSVPFKMAAKAAGVFAVTRGATPHIQKFADIISFKDAMSPTGTPGTTTEGPKTPSRFVEPSPDELKEFRPGEANHNEYSKKTLEKIKALATPPVAPAGGVAVPAVSPAEISRRESLFRGLDAEYRRGKMALAEYLKRTEDILAGRGKLLVVDHTGAIDKAESVRNVKQRIVDRIPVVSQFTKNNPNGSAAASSNAIQAAKNRIKGTAYESVDFAGAKVDFADTNAKALFDEFRDKIERYSQMQEWDANDRLIQSKEALVSKYNADIQSRLVPGTQAHILSAQIDALIRTAPTVTTSSGGVHGTTTNVLPNPQIDALMKQLERLNPDIPGIYTKITALKGEIGDLEGKTLSYRPKTTAAIPATPGTPRVKARAGTPAIPAVPGTPAIPAIGPRQQFQADIRAMKLEISNPVAGSLGLIQRINAHAGSVVIPDTAFNPKDLKLNKITFLEIAKIALKK